MNKTVMVIWGLIIIMLCTLLYLIGYNERDVDYINFQNDLKHATRKYIKDKGLSTKNQLVFTSELLEDNYYKDKEDIEKYCVESVVYNETIFKDEFIINKNCDIKE